MKKTHKILSLTAVSVLGASMLVACDTSKDNDFVSEYTGQPGIYISPNENAYLELTEGSNTVTYLIYRDEASGEVTVPVTITPLTDGNYSDIYTFPSSVTFPSGSKEGPLVIGYDITKAEMGEEMQFQLEIDADSTPFSTNTTVLTLVNPAPWTYLGVGDYYDWFWGISDDSYGPAKVTVWQQDIDKNLFRISNPYVALNGENSYFQFRILQPGDVYEGVAVTQSDLVGWSMVYCEYYSSYSADMYFISPMYAGDDESYWVYNRVVDYQENGLPGYIQLAGWYYMFDVGGYDYSSSPTVEIIFPDFVVLDTSVSVAYEGVLTNSSQEQEVLLNVELGSDVSYAEAAVAAGTDADALVNSIINGTANVVEVSSSGYVKVPFSSSNTTGNYVAAVVTYAGNEAKNYGSVSFFYIAADSNYDPDEGWESLGYVEYTDAFICARTFLNDPPYSYYIEIQQNEETPTLYRLVNPYGPGSIWDDSEYNPYTATYIEVDVTDPTRVTMPYTDQNFVIPYEDGTEDILGQVWCLAEYYLANGYSADEVAEAGYFGTFEDGKITFPAISLMAYWESNDPDPDYTGYFTANFVLDYDKAVATNGEEVLMLGADGQPVAPFLIDFNTLTQTAPSYYMALAPQTSGLQRNNKFTSFSKVGIHLYDKNDVKSERTRKIQKAKFEKINRTK